MHWIDIKHLPLWSRITHHKSRRTVGCVTLGVCMMLTGSVIAGHRHELAESIGCVSHWVFDTAGYFIHGVGMIPALRHIEPFWSLLLGED